MVGQGFRAMKWFLRRGPWDSSKGLEENLAVVKAIRDAVGYVFDLAMDPINYVIPLAGGVGRTVENTVNERALNLETFESVEEGTLDLYSAVRNFYLRNREKQIRE